LRDIGAALAGLHREAAPTVVIGIESSGFVLGPLVAVALDVGFAEIRKDLHPEVAGERLLRRTTTPDYRGKSTTLTLRPNLITPSDRVLLVDDWIETGANATAARDIVSDAEATWVGVVVVVDALPSGTRRQLQVRSLARSSSLPWRA
jgi:adenine phosphoribosyltransferase